jgi:tRNA(fMet)-specific endonuclease VapC
MGSRSGSKSGSGGDPNSESERPEGENEVGSGRFETGLLDTNTVILLNRFVDSSVLPVRPSISTITLAELSVGPLATDDPQERSARQAHLQLAEASFQAIPFDAAAARCFGAVAASLRQSGRKPAARAYDALIASVAIAREMPLFTVNAQDFVGIPGVEVVAIPHPDTQTP